MSGKNIAILIPVFNGIRFTQKCLNSLYGIFSTKGALAGQFKVVVIDDGSTDGTREWIEQHYPETVVLTGNGNLWWSGGINKGIEYALQTLQCDYTLWWNNDIHCAEDYFINLLNITEKLPESTIVGSKIYFAGIQNTIWSMGGKFDPRSGKKDVTGMFCKDNESYSQITEADWLPGMGTLIHHTVYKKIGMLNDIEFPQYHGDSDFTYRALLAGFSLKVYPQLKIWNDKSNSGLEHNNNFRLLIKSLGDLKSNNHFMKDLLFYRKYATSILAYRVIIRKYYFYIGGFLKWKILNLVGIKKQKLN
jgi:GT2 family glycosyltransferase